MQNERLREYLLWKYQAEPLLKRGNLLYPVAVFQTAAQHKEQRQSLLATPLDVTMPTDGLIADPALRHRLANSGRDLYNGQTYTLRELSVAPELRLHCALGTYFDMLDTCDALEWEAINAAESLNGGESNATFERRLPQRMRLHEQVAHPVRDGRHRSVALAVSVLIAYARDGGYDLILRRRSMHVAIHPGLLHVVPSFMLQPVTGHYTEEFSLTHQIQREYLEELFDRPEVMLDEACMGYFLRDPRLQYFPRSPPAGGAEFHITGSPPAS